MAAWRVMALGHETHRAARRARDGAQLLLQSREVVHLVPPLGPTVQGLVLASTVASASPPPCLVLASGKALLPQGATGGQDLVRARRQPTAKKVLLMWR
jgi:hypothetical protein